MNSHFESKVLRALAVIALAAAFLVSASIAFDAGVIGEGSDSQAAIDLTAAGSPASTAPADASEEQPAAEEAAAVEKSYVVQDGDSFYSISRKFNTSIAEIQQKNPNLDPSNLSPGTRITVP